MSLQDSRVVKPANGGPENEDVLMPVLRGKIASVLLWVVLLLTFAAGMQTQRLGIPRKVKSLLPHHLSTYSYAPTVVVVEAKPKDSPEVRLREFPYPFHCALAYASDIDGCSAEQFEEIHRYLNTTDMTTMGPGLGLDIADSMWMYDSSDEHPSADMPSSMAYWKGVKPGVIKDAEQIRQYIDKGWIDSLHTYGNFNSTKGPFTRELAKATLDELSSRQIRLDTWIDHGGESIADNFTQYGVWPAEHGDDPGSPDYHTDLLLAYGVRYAWGPAREEFGTKELCVPLALRDGRRIWEFSRYHSGTSGSKLKEMDWYPNRIDHQLQECNLEKLKANGLWEIVANHFGSPTWLANGEHVKTRPPFGPEARKALCRLAYAFRRGEIMVLRTSRLLKYYVVSKCLDWEYDAGTNVICIKAVDDPVFGRYVPALDDLRGITFYIDRPDHPAVSIGATRLGEGDLTFNAHDGTAYSVTIRPYFTLP
jgi:hypothetical protein